MTVRWGILGCGAVCEVKSGPAFQRARGSELVAVMRRRADLARDFARRHDVPHWYDDAGALIADPRVDAVYVASPPGNHLELALRVSEHGKPAYVEKPMARTHGECQRMIEAFERKSLPLFVAYYRRALPRFLKAKQLLDSGVLGAITSISCRYASARHSSPVEATGQTGGGTTALEALPWRLRAEEAGAGLFLDLGSHTLDILDFLLGPLSAVQGSAANVASPYAVEDTVVMSFRTSCGALGTGAWNFASARSEDVIVISGTRAELRLSTFGNEPIELHQADGIESFDLPNPVHIQEPMIQTIVDALSGQGSCASTGVSAARTSAVMDQVLLGYYGSRDDGFWKNPALWPGRAKRQAH